MRLGFPFPGAFSDFNSDGGRCWLYVSFDRVSAGHLWRFLRDVLSGICVLFWGFWVFVFFN